MFVHVFLGYSKAKTISDDLESFFHLLLYFAICFFPHNASDVVDELLFSYFDDCTHALHGQTTGSTKFLWLRPYSTSEPAHVRSHPMNIPFCELLRWFKALYTPNRDIEELPVQDDPTDQADEVPALRLSHP
ncbi:hypothetical protein GSI_04029 [Ganoderma sinense ZZ0214-1]|uniref:Fungal-type protein kinase domain-containing protein n=1 Tax=Ganoderma sinense ZZ0214-1 TaxID=1077348 RepID=A0A2G8SI54_9APHY|nr:hypothetical protein GSI_04029 [Ganoderma sinense ZZ0214-1]